MHDGKWVGVGGKLEPGESPEECIIREVEEETGLIIKKLNYKGLITFANAKGPPWYVYVFTSKSFTGKIKESREGNLKWIDNKDLLKLNLWESDKTFMSWLNKKKIFSAKFKGADTSKYQVSFY